MAKIINVYDAAGNVVRVYDPKNLRKDQDAEECAKSFITGRRGYTYGAEGEEPVTEEAKTTADGAGNPPAGNGQPDTDVVTYAELTLAELKTEAAARQIVVPEKAKKADVIQLLEKYDSENAA